MFLFYKWITNSVQVRYLIVDADGMATVGGRSEAEMLHIWYKQARMYDRI